MPIAQRQDVKRMSEMFKNRTNFLFMTFLLPIAADFEKLNAQFQSENAKDAETAYERLRVTFKALKRRVYFEDGNPKPVDMVVYGESFIVECKISCQDQDERKILQVQNLQS